MTNIIQFPTPPTIEDRFLQTLDESQAELFGEIMENIMQDFITQIKINDQLTKENKLLKQKLKRTDITK